MINLTKTAIQTTTTKEEVKMPAIQKMPLNIMYDFVEAQKLLDLGEENIFKINARHAYNDRVKNDFVGTYPILVERQDDYKRFVKMMKKETCYKTGQYELNNQWYDNIISYDEMQEKLEALKNCTCSKCSFEKLTFEQWKSGIIQEVVYINNEYFQGEKVKEIRVNKALQRAGFSKELCDFYATQVKTEKFVYITISDRPQHIAGMSAYAEMDNWGGGFGGTSCQDPRHDDTLAFDLSGSLHDNKLLVAYLHANIEDLEDMEDKLLARCTMRITSYNDELFAIGNKTYGKTENRDLLEKALDMLNDQLIYSQTIHSDFIGELNDETIRHEEEANGRYYLTYESTEEVYIHEYVEEEVDCTCPMCNGSETYEVYIDRIDEYREITCPLCGGSGSYTTFVSEEVDTYEEIEIQEDLGSYTGYDGEGFDHYGRYTIQYLNKDRLERDVIRFGRKLV